MRSILILLLSILPGLCLPSPGLGQERVTDGMQALYRFLEGSGSTVADLSENGPPLNLTISDSGSVTWLQGGGLVLDSPVTLSSVVPATRIYESCMMSQALTVEVWLASANLTQSGPARIVAYSQDGYPNGGNFVLGQDTDDPSVRLRSTVTDQYGQPGLAGDGEMATALQHLVFTRDAAGTTGLFVDGVLANSGSTAGTLANWGSGYPLTLGSEPPGDRNWLGMLQLVAVFDRALSGVEVAQNFAAGPQDGPMAPGIVVQPRPRTVAVGSSATFSLIAAGSGTLSYQWQRDQVDIPGATSSIYQTEPATLADDGALFRCVVTSSEGQAISDEARLTIQDYSGLVRIMPCGDSITYGTAGSSDDTGYRRSLYLQLTGSGHTVEFVGSQTTGIPLDFDRDHEGHGGWHADQIRDNIHAWLEDNPADIVLLHIGTNDITGGDQDVQEVEDILNEIDRYEADFATSVKVLLARIILRDDSLNPETIVFNDSVEAMALLRIAGGDDIVLVDQENALIYPDDLADSLHPNDSGYGKMADEWFAVLDGILVSDELSGVVDPVSPTGFDLLMNVPNPFNPMTAIKYDLPGSMRISLKVIDLSGRLIAILKNNEVESAGRHEVVWFGRDQAGQQVASGVYFYRLEAGTFNQTRRMVLMK